MENTASWVRRLVALAVDWAACSLVTLVGARAPGATPTAPTPAGSRSACSGWRPRSVVALAGGSFGQLGAGAVRVLRLDGRPVPLLPALARQLLVCLVIPPLVFRLARGLHDLAAGRRLRPGAQGPHGVAVQFDHLGQLATDGSS